MLGYGAWTDIPVDAVPRRGEQRYVCDSNRRSSNRGWSERCGRTKPVVWTFVNKGRP